MRRLTTVVIVAVMTYVMGVFITGFWSSRRASLEKQNPRVEIPPHWESLHFKDIDERTNVAGLPQLRTVLLPNDDLEVRVWVGFGIYGEDAFILRRSSGQWSALHLHGMYERYPPEKFQETFAVSEPKSGWEGAWVRLVYNGIITLPDGSDDRCTEPMFDGTSYIVEINKDKTYRAYAYGNPNYSKCEEAKQMLAIGSIIAEEFGLKEFDTAR